MINWARFVSSALVWSAALQGVWSTTTAHADPLSEAQERYRREMASCEGRASREDIDTCRKEARNALAEAQRKRLDPALPADDYRQNALQRCQVHEGEDRRACEARIRGEGRREGSIEGGGILRELETTAPAK